MSFVPEATVLGPGERRAIQAPGHPIIFKATAEGTGGAYSLLETVVTGNGPTQHIHKTEEEAFYVLEGEVNIKVGEQIARGTAGSFVLIPRGTVHTFWNVGPTPAKHLVIFSPPGFEQAFVEVWGERGEDAEEMDHATYVERLKAVSGKYNQEIVGPPLG
jgi:mannose-6-phosphate isomerase-like protein (cupin superfamily)